MVESEVESMDYSALINKCRLCFRNFAEDNKIVPIDENIKQKFFLLTNLVVSWFLCF